MENEAHNNGEKKMRNGTEIARISKVENGVYTAYKFFASGRVEKYFDNDVILLAIWKQDAEFGIENPLIDPPQTMIDMFSRIFETVDRMVRTEDFRVDMIAQPTLDNFGNPFVLEN